MGFFGKKKNAESSSSVLSESEIQKKLYGEFSEGTSYVVTGDREYLKAPASTALPPKESSLEKDAVSDLFSVQKDVLSEPKFLPRRVSPEQKSADPRSRHASLRDFEKKPVPSASVSSSSDAHTRFPYNRPPVKKWISFPDLLSGFFEKMDRLVKFFSDPEQMAIRRVFYWGTAVLVVFILFWGVNTLNSQREEAMRVRYKIPGEPVPAKTSTAVKVVVPAKPATERSVVITPVPVRPPKARVSEGSAATSVPVSGPYVIQVVTYPTKQDADQVAETFRREGFRVFVKESTRPSGRLYFLVFLGGFRTEAEAQAQLLKFRAKEVARPFQDAFVRSSRS
ncbi:MAG: SPOR domain-containing protein [Candidatus Omnitrophota bacterium]